MGEGRANRYATDQSWENAITRVEEGSQIEHKQWQDLENIMETSLNGYWGIKYKL